ncbi:MAG: hypothetical protein QF724_04080 [Planctomycetota bacterium]|jgi:predicted DCC family thiol-disulfide oxidoreductase YuxK|nr:hypothetical protein [Planctomycetota bacterium]MDP6520638.1 hypothetical protein [Planctomycetota bacterium]MDP6838092.1 hypothetical protein [Planctomycetota bacterium]MDP6954901.1 hypothetical protein [Planctomycetota bacterium]
MTTAPQAEHKPEHLPEDLVLFDGGCPPSQRTVAWQTERDGQRVPSFVPLQGTATRDSAPVSAPQIPDQRERCLP